MVVSAEAQPASELDRTRQAQLVRKLRTVIFDVARSYVRHRQGADPDGLLSVWASELSRSIQRDLLSFDKRSVWNHSNIFIDAFGDSGVTVVDAYTPVHRGDFVVTLPSLYFDVIRCARLAFVASGFSASDFPVVACRKAQPGASSHESSYASAMFRFDLGVLDLFIARVRADTCDDVPCVIQHADVV